MTENDNFNLEDFDPDGHFKNKEKQQQKNEKLLEEFKKWLEAKGLTDKTVEKHVENIDFYINEYLTYYGVQGPEEDIYEINAFLGDWFIRKAMWASKTAIKDYCAGFKKFYKFLEEKEMIEQSDYQNLQQMIKENKSDWLAELDSYDDFEDIW
ncbi:MAG: recombinase [Halanaerobium sp.]